MEKFVAWLPSRPQPLLVRYLATAAIMGGFAAAQIALALYTQLPALFLLLGGIFICAVLFDRGTGIFASLIGTASTWFIISRIGWDVPIVPAVALFFVIGTGLSIISDALRSSIERAAAAERAKDLLFRELSHRTQNNLAIAASILSLQGRAQASPEARAALDTAQKRLLVMAELQRHLQSVTDGHINIPEFLEELCGYVRKSIVGIKALDIRVESEPLFLPSDRAVPLGLIVNELVTNALKHAFVDKNSGVVTVSINRVGSEQINLDVADNGPGCSPEAVEGLGSRLVRLLVTQMHGTVAWENAQPGCRVRIVFAED